jgi:hypothetical protein
VRASICMLALAVTIGFVPANTDAEDADIAGIWQGRYVCLQGETLLRLTILPEGAGPERAFFYFYPPPGTNPGETGCFTLTPGFEKGSGKLALRMGHWIDQPDGYIMVSLEGEIGPGGKTFSGRILSQGCADFTLTRLPLAPDKSEACRPLTQ